MTTDPVTDRRDWEEAEDLAVFALQSLCDSRDAAIAEPLVPDIEAPDRTALSRPEPGRPR